MTHVSLVASLLAVSVLGGSTTLPAAAADPVAEKTAPAPTAEGRRTFGPEWDAESVQLVEWVVGRGGVFDARQVARCGGSARPGSLLEHRHIKSLLRNSKSKSNELEAAKSQATTHREIVHEIC